MSGKLPETLPIRQSKFLNGEISPLNFGDVEHPKWRASLRTCLNWLPIPQGAVVKRPGTQFVAPVKDASYAPRLVPFVFSDNQTFVLEIGNLYIRVYQKSQYVGIDGNLHTYGDAYAGGYYEVITPFTTAMLPYLKFSQTGDVVTICYGGQVSGVAALAPRDLTHTTGAYNGWTLSATNTKIPLGMVTWSGSPSALVNAWSGGTTYSQGDRAILNNIEWVSIQNSNIGNSPPSPATLNFNSLSLEGNLFWMPLVDQVHPAVAWDWVFTLVVQDPAGVVYESASTTSPLSYPTALDTSRTLPIFTGGGIVSVVGATTLFKRLYRRSKGGIYGWVCDFTGTTVYDDGRTPDYTRQPPQGTDPFLVNGADSYPAVVGALDQRRAWASSLLLPSMLFLSKVGDLYNYDSRNTPGADTDALNLLLTSEVLEQVRSIVSMRRGLILTGQGEWAMQGGPVSRSNNDAKRQSAWGSSWLNPIRIGTGILFNTAKSNMVRDFYPLYGLYSDIWDGQDLTSMARHMFNNFTLKDWAFQSTPYPTIWAVRNDGVLLSCTYQHAPPSFGQQLTEGVIAWARHTTGLGLDTFEAVCSVPEPPEDAVYTVVSRPVDGATVRYIERFSPVVCPASPYVTGTSDARYGKYLDSCVVYDGHNDQLGYTNKIVTMDSVANPGSGAAADYGIGAQITINLNAVSGPFVAADAANPCGSVFVFDLENKLGMGTFKAHIVKYTSSLQVVAELDSACTQAQVSAWSLGALGGRQSWAIAKGQISATHLSGYPVDSYDANLTRGILCLVDGDAQVPAAWAGGVASLATPGVVVRCGIAYNSDGALLDAWHAQAEIRNRLKRVVRIGFEVAESRGMWVGTAFDKLSAWKQRAVLDAYGVMPLQTGYFEERVIGSYDKSGAGVFRHFDPLPATVTSILREVELADT